VTAATAKDATKMFNENNKVYVEFIKPEDITLG
jgi:hypothetical protein